jgi:amidase
MSSTDVSVELGKLDATGQADLVRRGELTAAELVESAIERIESLNPTVNAVVTTAYEHALDIAATNPSGAFAGVPMLVKDLLIEVPGLRFTEGSRFLEGNVSSRESELAARYRRAGLLVLGKTNTPEFGMAPACEPLLFGPTRNPWDLNRSTSGSSGGSAAAVASGMVPVAHGNDLGGSLRYPASACGVFGLKPTRARNPLGPIYGDIMGGLACEHVLTRSVRDSAAILDVTAGPSPGDPYPTSVATRPFLDEVGRDPGRLRVAFSRRTPEGPLGDPDCLAALGQTLQLLESLGHDVFELTELDITDEVGAAIGTTINAALSWIVAYWVRELGREPEPEELEPATWVLRDAGLGVPAATYLLAVEELQRFTRQFASLFERADVWLTPTLSGLPLPIGTMASTPDDPMGGLMRGGATIRYAGIIANITGNPAMSVPLTWNTDGLPIGMQFVASFGDEATLFRLASQLEVAQPWAHRWPATSISN